MSEPCHVEPAFSQHEYAVDYCETHDRPASECRPPDPVTPPCCTDTLGMPVPCEHPPLAPDLAALLHPWTCKPHRMDAHTDGGWLCQRAAADIAFRLAPKEPPWPDHADMSVDERR